MNWDIFFGLCLVVLGGFRFAWSRDPSSARRNQARIDQLQEGANEHYFEERRQRQSYTPHGRISRYIAMAMIAVGDLTFAKELHQHHDLVVVVEE